MLNKVTLIGRLGSNPELKYTPGGAAVVNVSLATTRRWKDKQSGERKEETEWHRLVFFTRLAEVVAEYVKKGGLIYVEGRIRTQKWQKEGQDHYTTEIMVGQMNMLGSKGDAVPNQPAAASAQNPVPSPSSLDDFDDVPF